MVKLLGPAFSLDATGMLGNAISFFSNRWGSIAGYYRQGQKKRSRAFSEVQQAQQACFANGVKDYGYLDPAIQYLWKAVAEGKPASGRCLYMGAYLNYQGLNWRFAPYPLNLWLKEITDKVLVYGTIIGRLETLVGVSLLYRPAVIATKNMLPGYNAVSNFLGDWFMVREEDLLPGGFYSGIQTVAHESMHNLLNQHSYRNDQHPDTHEIMATECGIRVKNNDLFPIYTYKGSTTQQIIDGQLY